jgi:hypothetical protein
VTPVLSRNLVDCKINRFNIFAVNFTGPGMEFSILHSCTAFIESNCFCIALQEDRVKGQPGARSRKVHGSIRPLWGLMYAVFLCIPTRGCFQEDRVKLPCLHRSYNVRRLVELKRL